MEYRRARIKETSIFKLSPDGGPSARYSLRHEHYRRGRKGGHQASERSSVGLWHALRVEPVNEQTPTLFETLKDFDGIANDLPTDLAANLDHYVHGHPRP